MQCEITLPADYDMAIIRHRVATRGASTDAFVGLGLKAYLPYGHRALPVKHRAAGCLRRAAGGQHGCSIRQ